MGIFLEKQREAHSLDARDSCIKRKIVAPMEEWSIPELALWDCVPSEERECEQQYVHVVAGADPRYQYQLAALCSRSWCASCEKTRTWRYRNRIANYVTNEERVTGGTRHWWFLTRSVRNDMSARLAFDEFLVAKRKFHMHVSQPWHPFNKVTSWIGTQELVYNPKTGYNLHQHMLVGAQRRYDVDRDRVGERWNDVVGYDAMTHLVRMDTQIGAIAYLGKYISKATWGGLSRGRAYMIRDTLKGRNRIQKKPGTGPTEVIDSGFLICCVNADGRSCQRDAIDMDIRHGSEFLPES